MVLRIGQKGLSTFLTSAPCFLGKQALMIESLNVPTFILPNHQSQPSSLQRFELPCSQLEKVTRYNQDKDGRDSFVPEIGPL